MKQKSREALVQAALELFAEQGIDAPSLDAICDRAGYTRGVFYVHFQDREQLLVAVMEKVGAAYLGSVFQEIEDAEEAPRPGRRFAYAADRFLASVRRGEYPLMSTTKAPLVRMHQLLTACARSDLVRTRYRELVQLATLGTATLVADDQKNGGIRDDLGADTVATMSLAIILGTQTMIELGIPVDPETITKTMLRLVELKSRGARASR